MSVEEFFHNADLFQNYTAIYAPFFKMDLETRRQVLEAVFREEKYKYVAKSMKDAGNYPDFPTLSDAEMNDLANKYIQEIKENTCNYKGLARTKLNESEIINYLTCDVFNYILNNLTPMEIIALSKISFIPFLVYEDCAVNYLVDSFSTKEIVESIAYFYKHCNLSSIISHGFACKLVGRIDVVDFYTLFLEVDDSEETLLRLAYAFLESELVKPDHYSKINRILFKKCLELEVEDDALKRQQEMSKL